MDTISFVESTKLCFACREGLTGEEKICFACNNDLTGEIKNFETGEEWECFCAEWVCNCKPCKATYCPICDCEFNASDYLATVFEDKRILWLANMVMHYRHDHRAWDRSHGYISRKYGQGTYERQKSKINEQAKRQIIRKATKFLRDNNVTPDCFAALQGTTEETMQLANKKLNVKTLK